MTFELLKKCLVLLFIWLSFRCVMPNVDPLTGIKNPESEPFQTLKRYFKILDKNIWQNHVYIFMILILFRSRMVENVDSPIFGIDLALEVAGKIRVGDVVFLGEL